VKREERARKKEKGEEKGIGSREGKGGGLIIALL